MSMIGDLVRLNVSSCACFDNVVLAVPGRAASQPNQVRFDYGYFRYLLTRVRTTSKGNIGSLATQAKAYFRAFNSGKSSK